MINIAIDGHVGSGKSTLAKGIAEELNIKMLDTGAIYRGIACSYKSNNYKSVSLLTVEEFLKNMSVKINFIDKVQHVYVNDIDYTPYIRQEEISMLASKISPFPNVRKKVLEIQRKFANEENCVMEGRDIGTVVLPNADLKFFITAKPEIRAQRRFEQLKDKTISFEKILKDLKERDYQDENREIAPLKPANDAIILDTSDLTLDETIKYCVKLIKEKINF